MKLFYETHSYIQTINCVQLMDEASLVSFQSTVFKA